MANSPCLLLASNYMVKNPGQFIHGLLSYKYPTILFSCPDFILNILNVSELVLPSVAETVYFLSRKYSPVLSK